MLQRFLDDDDDDSSDGGPAPTSSDGSLDDELMTGGLDHGNTRFVAAIGEDQVLGPEAEPDGLFVRRIRVVETSQVDLPIAAAERHAIAVTP